MKSENKMNVKMINRKEINKKRKVIKKQLSYILLGAMLLCQLLGGKNVSYAMEITEDDQVIYEAGEERALASIEAYELEELPDQAVPQDSVVTSNGVSLYSSALSVYGGVIEPSSVAHLNLDVYGNDYIYQQMNEKLKSYYNEFEKYSKEFVNTKMDAQIGHTKESEKDLYLLGPIAYGEDDVKDVIDYGRIFIYQNPQYYFLTNKLYYGSGNLYLSVYPEFADGEDRSLASEAFFSKVDTFVDIIKKEKTAYDKHKKAFDIVCEHLNYQFIDGYYDQSVYVAVMEGKTVCAGFTKMYEMLANAAGVLTVGVTSPDPEDSVNKGLHAWNKVQLDGKWYNVDTTWAVTSKNSEREKYLDRSDAALLAIDNGSGYHDPHAYYNGLAPKCPNEYVKDEHPVSPEKVVPNINVSYRTHVQTYGWQDFVKNGVMSGTSGKAKRLEAIEISVSGNKNVGIQYTTHCQSYGWMPWSADGDMCGTEGEAKRLEAIKIQLTGIEKDYYDVYYRVHAQTYGWLGWAKNGEPAGTAGYAKRLEGIQIVVVKKDTTAPNVTYMGVVGKANVKAYEAKTGTSPVVNQENTSNIAPVIPGIFEPNVTYRTHVQTYGWQGWKFNGSLSGTTGMAKRLEGIEIRLTNKPYSGGIRYRTHVQTYGWQNWKYNGEMAGTSGQAKRLESICIQLTGEMAEYYDVYYRVHSQTFGWLGWAKNGEPAGTSGFGKRLESIQIGIAPKNSPFPKNTVEQYISK